jgi:acyl-CoA synthetase (AMP-forming)/AMP-acid ligase II
MTHAQRRTDVTIDVHALTGRRATNRWERMSVGDVFERVRWSYPDKPAIVGCAGAFLSQEWSALSYSQADDRANQVAHALLGLGLTRGDKLLLFCENSVEAFVAKIGAAKAGVVCAPVNVRMGHEVQEHLLRTLEPAAIIADAALLATASPTVRRSALPKVLIGSDPVPAAGDDWIDFHSWVEGNPVEEPVVTIAGDDVWQIMFTSGTTSMPKGVLISHANAYMAACGFSLTHTRGLAREHDLVMCTMLPAIYHAADQCHCFPAFVTGGTLVLGRSSKPADIAAAVTEHRVTATFVGSAQMLGALMDEAAAHPDRYDLSSITSLLWAWGAMPPATTDAVAAICGPDTQLVGIIGQTETTASTRFWPSLYGEEYRRTAPAVNHVGRPSALLAAALLTPEGRVIGPDEVGVPGELVYRSPATSAGYYADPDATADAVRDGWFHSGDTCQYDAHGILVSVDRIKDMIKSGGENIPSQRIETVISDHAEVRRVAVVGLPHPKWGEAVTAMVVVEDASRFDEDDLLEFCGRRLARMEIPKRVVVLDELPTTVGGKIRKSALRSAFHDLYQPVDAMSTEDEARG